MNIENVNIEKILGEMMVFAAVILLVVIVIYIASAIFLNKFNKLLYGKGTPMCWIPVANIYLLGKLTVNKFVGWILVICIFLTGETTTTINGVETTSSFLPESINSVVQIIYNIVVLLLFIYAIIKYNVLKKVIK